MDIPTLVPTVAITAVLTVVLTLLFDWWVKPRLEVRNELFKMRAQDRIALIRTLKTMMIHCGQMVSSEHENPEIRAVLQQRAASFRERLSQDAEGLLLATVTLSDQVTPTTREMLSICHGYIVGMCLSDDSHKVVGQHTAEAVGLLLDAVSASKFTITNWYRQRQLRSYLDRVFPNRVR